MTDIHEILVFNTLSNSKEVLKPLNPGKINMYACGVTVYDHCHIGHAMQAIFFDVIRNYLKFAGYEVTYVRNYTDVDDKIIARAKELGMRPDELSRSVIESSQRDMASIGVRPADHEPCVSESIPEIIAMIEELTRTDAAYRTAEGDVYYRVRSKSDYGKLSNRKPDELRSGTRAINEGQKEDELDFALWKHDDTPGASWSSPWGIGRPGWHIECSAMAKKFLGDSFDIHGGGRDLVFPHHENEVAQSESANHKAYASYWLHSGLLTINKQKMSKSLGNHISIQEFVKNWPGEVLRLAYLSSHYTSNVDFSLGVFQSCAKRLLFYYETMGQLNAIAAPQHDSASALPPGHSPNEIVPNFHKYMSNDFATPLVLRDLLAFMKKARELVQGKITDRERHAAARYCEEFRKVFGVLGILCQEPATFIEELKTKVLPTLGLAAKDIEHAIAERGAARASKDFARADQIRNELFSKGIVLMDGVGETKWTLNFSDV